MYSGYSEWDDTACVLEFICIEDILIGMNLYFPYF